MFAFEASFWRDRRVLVTGHTGFKGAWLVLWLTGLGARVTGLSLPPHTNPSLFALCAEGSCTDRYGDVADPARDLTTVEFTAADLPEEPPVQDPGPVNDNALAQSQQQQQQLRPAGGRPC